MRKLMVVMALMGALLLAVALPAAASDGSLLGSGATAPKSDVVVVAPADSGSAVEVARAVGHDALAATGFDSGMVLLIGLGLTTAGASAVVTSRRRASA